MITKIKGKCQYEGCEENATDIACGRDDGHENPDCYCAEHARIVADEGYPEYNDACPNCNCHFGVN